MNHKTKSQFKWKQKYTIPLILLVMWIFLSIAADKFFTVSNIMNLLRQTSVLGVCAVGATCVILSGETDLSLGAIMGVVGMVVAKLMVSGVPILVALLIGVAVGALCGTINGVIIQTTGIPSFICTMGTMTAYRGIAQLISSGKTIANLPAAFGDFSAKSFFNIPYLAWLFFIVAIVGQLVLYKTVFGRKIYAVGSNPAVAELSGISVKKTSISVFAIAGALAGVAGIMYAVRMAQGFTSAGSGYELNCIASAVIGGASLGGGEGSIIGTVVGCFIIQTLQNGGNLLKISSFWLDVVTGIVLVVAVAIDTLSRKKLR